jgi:hypothetical protein
MCAAPLAGTVFVPADQPKWDSWGRLFERLLSRVPLIHTDGNHEVGTAGRRGPAKLWLAVASGYITSLQQGTPCYLCCSTVSCTVVSRQSLVECTSQSDGCSHAHAQAYA